MSNYNLSDNNLIKVFKIEEFLNDSNEDNNEEENINKDNDNNNKLKNNIDNDIEQIIQEEKNILNNDNIDLLKNLDKKSPIEIKNFPIKNENNDYNNIFYDEFSKRIIIVNKNNLKVYNRIGTKLLKEFKSNFDNFIKFITINKECSYCLIINILSNTETLSLYNDKQNNPLSTIKDNFNYLLNIFFISNTIVCFIYVNKIKFININSISNLKENIVINCDKTYLIVNFFYEKKYNILIIERTDKFFEIYNLNKKEFIKESIKKFNLNFITKISQINDKQKSFQKSKSKSLFKNSNNKKEMDLIKNEYFSTKLNNKNKYYLKNIYNELYFIILSYDDKTIYILLIKNLRSFPEISENENELLTIDYYDEYKNSYLQFIDNLIIIHNFTKNQMLLLDIKSKQKIFYSIKNDKFFSYGQNFFICDKILIVKEQNIENNNKKVIQYDQKIYIINFLSEIYLNNLSETSQYLSLYNISRRKNSKNIVLNLLRKLLISDIKYKYEITDYLFNKFINDIKNNENLIKQLSNSFLEKNKNIKKDELYIPIKEILLSKKNMIIQNEIITNVFEEIIIKNLINNDEKYISLIINLINFYKIFLSYDMTPIEKINLIFIKCFEKIKDLNNLIKVIQMSSILPNKKEIALFLLKKNINKNNKYLIQIGMDILLNIMNLEEIIYFLEKEEGIEFTLKFISFNYENYKPILKKILNNLLIKNKENNNLRIRIYNCLNN